MSKFPSRSASSARGVRPPAALTIALGVALLSGCGAASTPAPRNLPPTQPEDSYLATTNRHDHDVEVVVLSDQGTTFPLGTLRVQRSRQLLLPRALSGTWVQLQLRCVKTGELHTTRQMVLEPADRIDLTVQPLLSLSQLALH